MVTMKLRRPYTTASIWSSGKITCTGATSEDQAKVAARRYSRCLQKLGFNVRLRNFRIVNVLGTCAMPWGIKIVNFSEKYKKDASYEPELHPGVTYKLHSPRATLKIFSTGSITVTGKCVRCKGEAMWVQIAARLQFFLPPACVLRESCLSLGKKCQGMYQFRSRFRFQIRFRIRFRNLFRKLKPDLLFMNP
uniref:TATA box-binding protein-like 1 n=1 Tax=Anopheles coluzzii TaxID=1518534 RepID=A0A8W7PW94_ANOCL